MSGLELPISIDTENPLILGAASSLVESLIVHNFGLVDEG